MTQIYFLWGAGLLYAHLSFQSTQDVIDSLNSWTAAVLETDRNTGWCQSFRCERGANWGTRHGGICLPHKKRGVTFNPKTCFVIISVIDDVLMLHCINRECSCHSCLRDSTVAVRIAWKGQDCTSSNSALSFKKRNNIAWFLTFELVLL